MRWHDNELALRAATPADAERLSRWWNDGAVMAHAGFPDGLGTTAEAVARQLAGDSPRGRRLILEVNGNPVGEANYRTVADSTAEIGIKICDASYQNRGKGTRFLRLLIRGLFDELGFRRIVLDTNLENARAQHVYEKLGFKRTGVRTDAWRDQRGRLQTAVDFELLPEGFVQQEM